MSPECGTGDCSMVLLLELKKCYEENPAVSFFVSCGCG